jgi:acyl-CoA synthetase (AMP-forming)/AMP-acid ligase II
VNNTSHSTLLDAIRDRTVASPDWPGLVLLHEDTSREIVTAAELWSDALIAANALRNAGLRPNDVVLIIMGHSRQLIGTFLGAMALGAAPAMVSTATPRLDLDIYRQRIEALARNAGAAMVVIRSGDAVPLQDVLHGLPCPLIASDTLSGSADPGVLPPAPSPEQVAFIQFTSGSGGVQKGVVHTHAGVLRYIASKQLGHPFGPDDVVVCWTPLVLSVTSALHEPVPRRHALYKRASSTTASLLCKLFTRRFIGLVPLAASTRIQPWPADREPAGSGVPAAGNAAVPYTQRQSP